MACVITVAPAKGGWGVRREGGEPWVFESGAQAEWSARKLGEALADSGTAVEIHIVLRDGSLGGRAQDQRALRAALHAAEHPGRLLAQRFGRA